jgi:hypothetical protein
LADVIPGTWRLSLAPGERARNAAAGPDHRPVRAIERKLDLDPELIDIMVRDERHVKRPWFYVTFPLADRENHDAS